MPWLENNDAIAADTSSAAAVTNAVVGIAAIVLAAPSIEPTRASSEADPAINSGAAITDVMSVRKTVQAARLKMNYAAMRVF